MIAHVIRWSVHNRFLVLLATVLIAAWGVHSLRQTPLDAFPDLSDTQVIVKASYPGKAPQIVEDQVTYPLTTTLLGVPGAKTVRAYSSFGDAFVYVLFDDRTDPYWARSRVLEYLSRCRAGCQPARRCRSARCDRCRLGTSMRSSIAPAVTISGNCARSTTGS